MKYKVERPYDQLETQKAIRARIIKVRGNMCELCGYNRVDILHIHHINRDRTNNDPNNLKLLCPNCHLEQHYILRANKVGGVA